jgi:hypothetical protein
MGGMGMGGYGMGGLGMPGMGMGGLGMGSSMMVSHCGCGCGRGRDRVRSSGCLSYDVRRHSTNAAWGLDDRVVIGS